MSARDDILAAFTALLQRATTEAPDVLPDLQTALQQAFAALPALPVAAADEPWHGLVGACPAMLSLRDRIAKYAPAMAPVLITGESGTGKERVAHALHALSRRAKQPFVAENCAAIPDSLIESVLFGHKKGSFTGAIKDHPGHFLEANGGTIFLDEIGEMKLPMQSKLLRTLQEGEVRAVGDTKTKKVDVRVIAATNQNLEAAVKAGRFREDLYFRLNVLRLELPPLRDRGHDIVVLARRFLVEGAAKSGRALRLSAEVEQVLQRAKWPGNVRQLQNEMQRLGALCDGPEVRVADLSADVRG
ncbi:MAG: sigma-54-dependent Fis family transcriptional regulator [Planctomycetes bacterium]|nr:sigma-54-dependent Fis family transcriptional regulator [Planctomycetota bacterium]